MDDDHDNPYRSPVGESPAPIGPRDNFETEIERGIVRAIGSLALAAALGTCLAMIVTSRPIKTMDFGERTTCFLLTAAFVGTLLGATLNVAFVVTERPKESLILPLAIVGGILAAVVFECFPLFE